MVMADAATVMRRRLQLKNDAFGKRILARGDSGRCSAFRMQSAFILRQAAWLMHCFRYPHEPPVKPAALDNPMVR
jgi:hypothetical protein